MNVFKARSTSEIFFEQCSSKYTAQKIVCCLIQKIHISYEVKSCANCSFKKFFTYDLYFECRQDRVKPVQITGARRSVREPEAHFLHIFWFFSVVLLFVDCTNDPFKRSPFHFATELKYFRLSVNIFVGPPLLEGPKNFCRESSPLFAGL
jgi:hypothetical protein